MYTVHCSYLEIYNEKVIDLLDATSSILQIKEDTKKGFYVDGLTWSEVKTTKEIWHFIKNGIRNRHINETNMNKESSRSHAVFTLTI